MVSKSSFLLKCLFTLVLIAFVEGDNGKNSEEYSKPDIGRIGKTRKSKMGKWF